MYAGTNQYMTKLIQIIQLSTRFYEDDNAVCVSKEIFFKFFLVIKLLFLTLDGTKDFVDL